MAQRKSAGTTRLGRDSNPKYLGVKVFAGQKVKPGQIIVRQRGTKFWPGKNTALARDYTIFSKIEGIVKFRQKKKTTFTGKKKLVSIVEVSPS